MKKSLAILFAFFMLGACSLVNSDWKELVGGKTIYSEGYEMGKFSDDASKFIMGDDDFSMDLELTKSTANSATYEGTFESVEYTVVFSSVTTSGGKAKVTATYDGGSNESDGDFSFTKD